MSKFADYQPHAHGSPAEGVSIRSARRGDAVALAHLSATRESLDLCAVLPRLRNELANDDGLRVLWVAEARGQVIAFARAAFTEQVEDSSPNHIPGGWYLGGVIVKPSWRRRGIGTLLIEARVEYLASRTRSVFYISNSTNLVSITLHAQLGFKELARDIHAPGMCFSGGGVGVLFGLALPARALLRGT